MRIDLRVLRRPAGFTALPRFRVRGSLSVGFSMNAQRQQSQMIDGEMNYLMVEVAPLNIHKLEQVKE